MGERGGGGGGDGDLEVWTEANGDSEEPGVEQATVATVEGEDLKI